MSEEYSYDLQKLYLEFLQGDKELFVRCNAILKDSYFDRTLRPAVSFMQEHVDKYGDMPTLEQMKVKGEIELQDLRDNTASHQEWFLDEFEKFCRHKALRRSNLSKC